MEPHLTAPAAGLRINAVDAAIILVYLVGIVALGSWAGLRRRRGATGQGYFLAGGTLTWPIIGLALFSTNISTVHLVSLAQSGYQHGLAFGNFEWMAAFTLIMLSLFFAPFYIRSRVATLPDFLESATAAPAATGWRWSPSSAVVIHIGFSLYTGAAVLEGLFGFPANYSIVVVALLTGLYTIIGGLLAVVWTESIQTVVLLLGAITITALALVKTGGWSGLTASVDPVQLTLLRPTGDASGLPWYSVLLGYPVLGIWYWCADQTIVQRVLGAKDEHHARLGPLFAGFIKILPVFIFVLPGVLCLALIRQGNLPDTLAKSENTYAHLITHLLPTGLRGLVAAALLAALMSTVSGALNSIATLFSYDIVKRWRPATGDRALVRVGRWATAVAMLAAIAWSPYVGRFEGIFQGINEMIGYVAPPITAVFLFGVFWKRASARAAILTLWTGFGLGLVLFLLSWTAKLDSFGAASAAAALDVGARCAPYALARWYQGLDIPFLMVPFYLFVICAAVMVAVSLVSPHRHNAESSRLVWEHPAACLSAPGWKGLGDYRVLATLLFACMAVLYTVFR
ncbi:sodium/solute symporter [bacterium]|nr:sodium/solute symporter [bacterium]